MRAIAGTMLGLLGLCLACPAAAGDMASLNVLGYSRDGKVFAFEEFGILDGSGGAYSSVYFIDIESDSFVAGTPIRVGRPEEEGQLAAVRKESRDKAAALSAKYGLADNPGILVAYNPPSEYDGNPDQVRYFPYLSAQIESMSRTLKLETREFPATAECLNMTGTYSGFTLKLVEEGGRPADILLHDDKSVPASRHCPNQYRIGAVVASEIADVPQIAMILVGSFGFEGNDQRWIAVPVVPRAP
jgi:predicted secreted protein